MLQEVRTDRDRWMAILASCPPETRTVAAISSGTALATSAGTFRQVLQRLPWEGTVRELGTLWTLAGPNGEAVRCFLTTHPHGWDLRLEGNGCTRPDAGVHGRGRVAQ